MSTANRTQVTVSTVVYAPVDRVWELWTRPEHVCSWNAAIDEWHTPHAENDLREGGKFSFRMEARDGSMGFDFGGVYDAVSTHELISYTLGDDRKVTVTFTPEGDATRVEEVFEAEAENPVEMQRGGWQAILDNFKRYAEEKR